MKGKTTNQWGFPGSQRNGLHIGARVRTNARYRGLHPKSRLLLGEVLYFCRGTECRVHFDGRLYATQIDQRFLELV